MGFFVVLVARVALASFFWNLPCGPQWSLHFFFGKNVWIHIVRTIIIYQLTHIINSLKNRKSLDLKMVNSKKSNSSQNDTKLPIGVILWSKMWESHSETFSRRIRQFYIFLGRVWVIRYNFTCATVACLLAYLSQATLHFLEHIPINWVPQSVIIPNLKYEYDGNIFQRAISAWRRELKG